MAGMVWFISPLRPWRMYIPPLFDVLVDVSFWRLVSCSALFITLLSWDMAADEVSWLQSFWIPLLPLGFVVMLRCIAHYFVLYLQTRRKPFITTRTSIRAGHLHQLSTRPPCILIMKVVMVMVRVGYRKAHCILTRYDSYDRSASLSISILSSCLSVRSYV